MWSRVSARTAGSRIPYRRINKLREVPPAERTAAGFVTYVYHLFPNVMVTTFPTNIVVIVLEPLAIDRTLAISYTVTDRPTDRHEAEVEVKRGEDFVKLGAVEDREVAAGIQRGLESGANEFLEFGRFEQALIHFHRSLDSALAKTGFVDSIRTHQMDRAMASKKPPASSVNRGASTEDYA